MSNTLAVYKNPEVLETVMDWFQATYGNLAVDYSRFLGVQDLYQSYHEYTTDPKYVFKRLNVNEFAKCLVACRIIDIGGSFRLIPNYEPAPSAITRATANI